MNTQDEHSSVVLVDDEHLQIGRDDGTEPAVYEIPEGDGFILDATSYEIRIPRGLGIESPNMIQVVVGRNHIYGVIWQPGARKYTVSSSTLIPLFGSNPFTKFESGQRLIIAIGYQEDVQTSQQPEFLVLWSGLVDVR